MSSGSEPSREVKLLPGGDEGGGQRQGGAHPPAAGSGPVRQLSELPRDELENLAEEYGVEAADYKSRQHLVAAIHDRRQMIGGMDREAMLDVIKWGRRPILRNATKEQMAREIARIGSMKFAGLSQRGLVVLSNLRGLSANAGEPVPELVRKLKKQEGLFARVNRKRRAWLGSMISNMVGEGQAKEYQFLPQREDSGTGGGGGIKEEIEESGLIGGIANRVKKSADAYLNQKLDEIEARIDRKLDEIDRRLSEWRDKEIANRIRILKITLWASVIVGGFALVYSYVKVHFFEPPAPNPPAMVHQAEGKKPR